MWNQVGRLFGCPGAHPFWSSHPSPSTSSSCSLYICNLSPPSLLFLGLLWSRSLVTPKLPNSVVLS